MKKILSLFTFHFSLFTTMIARLTGKLAVKNPDELILDVGGVGYQVFIPLSTFYELPERGEVLTLQIYTAIRENAFELYGFLTMQEKELFKLLYMSGRIEVDFENMGAPFESLLERMKQDSRLQGLSDASLKRIGTNMWIYTHGLITLTYGTSLENAEEFVRNCLHQMGRTVIEWEHYQNKVAEEQVAGSK